ncbi:hypothetical protein [Sphingobacterium sp.]|jgi:hypothetical protein|uniref:hypothetical protein n=1 Tax=Sphingobacterium sp. TaxID=341027 RepID=UPI00289E40DE|nr:hypothetical protein [Sphingobacterium sp.]
MYWKEIINGDNLPKLVRLLSQIGLLSIALLIAHYSTYQYLPDWTNTIISFIVELFTIPLIFMIIFIWIISFFFLAFKKEHRADWIMSILYSSATIILVLVGDSLV